VGTKSGSLQSRKQDFVRGAIWDAAIDLFVDKGFDETTVDDIAAAAGVSRRSFFRYFASKGDLMGQGIVEYGTALSELIGACPPATPAMDVVHRTVVAIAEAALAQPRTRKIIQISLNSASARQAQLSRMADAQATVARAFAARRGKNAAIAPKLLAGLTFSILDVTFCLWFEGDNENVPEIAEQVFRTLTGLLSDTAPAPRRTARKRTATSSVACR
jgi:AcrR family transcriptional regulator